MATGYTPSSQEERAFRNLLLDFDRYAKKKDSRRNRQSIATMSARQGWKWTKDRRTNPWLAKPYSKADLDHADQVESLLKFTKLELVKKYLDCEMEVQENYIKAQEANAKIDALNLKLEEERVNSGRLYYLLDSLRK